MAHLCEQQLCSVRAARRGGKTCILALLNTSVALDLLANVNFSDSYSSLEYPSRLALLYPHSSLSAAKLTGSLQATNGGDPVSSCRLGKHLGKNGPSRWHCQLRTEAEC